MLIALYQSHHHLPYWSGDVNPFDVFRPDIHRSLPIQGPAKMGTGEKDDQIIGYETIPLVQEGSLFSFLTGLAAVDASAMMAHVSALTSHSLQKDGWWCFPKRIWVQVSTLSEEFTEAGVPVVYDLAGKRKSEIKHIWGGDNGTHTPYEFFATQKLRNSAAQDSRVWKRFFEEQLGLVPELEDALRSVRQAQTRLKNAVQRVRGIQIFGEGELDTKLNERFNLMPKI